MALDVKILVAAHKPYWMPSDPCYVPVEVGAALREEHIEGYVRDDQGRSLSEKNQRYCELTALYWGWQNLTCDALGLCHYRRYFAGGGERGVLTDAEAQALLAKVPVVVPKVRNYVIESTASHYAHTHDEQHLDALRAGVKAVSPGRLGCLDEQLRTSRAHMFNMAIMRREILDPYCTWLFDVLEVAESQIDFSCMSQFQERCVGRLGEFLLDVWLTSESVPYREVKMRELEGVNWAKKGTSFLAAKFLGKKYDKSF